MRKISLAISSVLLALAASVSFAAGGTNTISWANPTLYVDGTTPFVSLCCTNVWRATDKNGTGSTFLTQVKGAATTYADAVTADGTYCYSLQSVSSKAGDGPSDGSPFVCKTLGASVPPVVVPPTPTKPNPPTNVTVK